jgi:arylsulfatase A-like enzyme
MTGMYSHKNGVYKFTALDHRQATLPKILKSGGYETALIGKYHLHSNPVGLEYFEILPGQGKYFDPEFIKIGDEHPSGWVQQGKKTTYRGHSSDVIADRTLEYLKNIRNSEKPFMLFCHFKAPHDTWEYAERYSDFLEDVEIPEPENLFDDYDGRSDALKSTLQYIGSEWGNHTNFEEETAHLKGVEKRKMQYQLYIKKYLRCVKGVDDNMGRILNYLDESGLAENTLVIYTGDQGFYLGEHGLYDKRFMYEEGLRMPFLMRWPGHIEKGTVSDGMILNVDFAPTILDAAGLEPPAEMQGRSFLELTKGTLPSEWRESMYYRYYYSHFETEPHYGIRTYRYKLIFFDQIGQYEMYDLKSDPQEMKNLYHHPEYQDIVMTLKNELARLQSDLDDDPANMGDKPNIGELAAKPIYIAKDVPVGTGNNTVLFRFRTNIGGTLFSKCDLETDPSGQDFSVQGIKILTINGEGIRYFDEERPLIVDYNLTDNEWHNIALVLTGQLISIYVDGQIVKDHSMQISPDTPGHKFNIGAGINVWGYQGYNFNGEISEVLVYDEVLSEEEIISFSEGTVPDGSKTLVWNNQE